MARTAYAAHGLVRGLERKLLEDTDVYTEALLNSWCTNYHDPEIDAACRGAGYTVPFTAGDVPEMAQTISAKFACAIGLQSSLVKRTAQTVERSAELMTEARDLLDRVAKHELRLIDETVDESGEPIQFESSGEDQHADAFFVGPPENWGGTAETREA